VLIKIRFSLESVRWLKLTKCLIECLHERILFSDSRRIFFEAGHHFRRSQNDLDAKHCIYFRSFSLINICIIIYHVSSSVTVVPESLTDARGTTEGDVVATGSGTGANEIGTVTGLDGAAVSNTGAVELGTVAGLGVDGIVVATSRDSFEPAAVVVA